MYADVDFVFHNVGHSSTDTIYSLRINDDVRERAEKALLERIAAVEPVKPDTPGYDPPRNKIVISFGDFTCFAVCYFIA